MDATIEHLTDTTLDEGGVMSRNTRWPLERVLVALAGTGTLVSALRSVTVSTWFLLLTAFVGINQWLYVLVGACPASVILRRAWHLRSAIYDDTSTSVPASKAVGIR